MDTNRQAADLMRNWKPPVEVARSAPRPVRLTGGGIVLCVISVLFLLGAVVGGTFLARKARNEAAESRRLLASPTIAQGLITKVWTSSGKDTTHLVAYQFTADGRLYLAQSTVPVKIWRNLVEGATLPIRYDATDPKLSHPTDWERQTLPPWLAFVIAGMQIPISVLLLFMLNRQKDLLENGRAAPAVITSVFRAHNGEGGRGRPIGRYEFSSMEGGAPRKGRGPTSKRPVVGEVICILYDPDNPKRNAPYPFQLVRIGE